jgi:DNA-binding MarR family transcriptional regulator
MQILTADRIERVRADWAGECPGLDTSPMEIIGRILRAEHLAGARLRRVLRDEGLDRGGFDVLATLCRSGTPYRLTPTRLYRELVLTSGAITHRVDALARAGLVERIPAGRDRRSNLVGLTAEGKSAADRAMAANLACEAAMIASLSAADRELLGTLLKRLLQGIEEEPREAQ